MAASKKRKRMQSKEKASRKNLDKRKKKSIIGGKRERVEKYRGQGFREVEYGYGSLMTSDVTRSVEKGRGEMAPMMERKTVKKGSKSRQVPSGVKKGRGRFRVGKWISEGLRGERKANPGLAKGYVLVLAGLVAGK